MAERPATVADLRQSEYRVVPVKEEMRRNLVRKLGTGEPLFAGILGYDDTVIPQVQNAILAGHDIILLGERGQAKSRLTRALTALLDDAVPVVAGCEINDDPYAPLCRQCRDLIASNGDDTPIVWRTAVERYSEKLATPDVAIADLIGEVDPIRVAEGRYLSDELTIHYGLVPRTHRGIFAINELPDLAERIQVGLLNIMEERDVQIRGYRVRLPLDVMVVATANPEDYTNRGRIITPLKDRFGTQVRTHYPQSIDHEMAIMNQEAASFSDIAVPIRVPGYMNEIVAEISQLARRHQSVNQRSGVSVRMTVTNSDTLRSNALRRALALDEREAVVRLSDLPALAASTLGKIEFETFEDGDDIAILGKLIKTAVNNVFRRHFAVHDFDELVQRFDSGMTAEVGERVAATAYERLASELPAVEVARRRLGEPTGPMSDAAVLEFILEGLHLTRRLNKTALDDTAVYGA